MSQNIKKKGYLSKLPVSKGLVKKWNRRWFVLHATSHEGVVRLEYYDSEECARLDVGKRTIPLRDSTAPSTTTGNKLHPYVFQLTTQIGNHTLAADSHPDLTTWMSSIKQVVQEDRLKRRRTKTQSQVVASPDDDLSQSLNESGISYKNRVDSGTYRVTVEENETSLKMNLSGTYSLELTPSSLVLRAPSSATIFTLPYRFLKNYGKQSGQFHFETGKNSPIGEGRLIFVTTCSKEVFGVVHHNIKKLRENMQRNPREQNKAPETQPQKKEPTQTKPTARPTPQTSVQPPPPPQGKKQPKTSISGGNRPGSRHSGELLDSSVVGTYRTSKNLEEQPGAVKEEAKSGGGDAVVATDMYATVDYSKKTSRKKQQQAETKTPAQTQATPTPKTGGEEEIIYADPYEEDPSYKAPPVPTHQNSIPGDSRASITARDSRASCALVELDDNAFDDSFDEDEDEGEDDASDGNLEPLTEGASNPLDEFTDFGGLSASSIPTTTTAASASTGIMKNLETLDFGFGPGNLEPQTGPAHTMAPPDGQNMMNFDFNFGDNVNFPAAENDPFSSNMAGVGAATAGDFGNFDLGKLDANFFERLEAIDVTDQPMGGAEGSNMMNPQDLDKFWTDMGNTVPKS